MSTTDCESLFPLFLLSMSVINLLICVYSYHLLHYFHLLCVSAVHINHVTTTGVLHSFNQICHVLSYIVSSPSCHTSFSCVWAYVFSYYAYIHITTIQLSLHWGDHFYYHTVSPNLKSSVIEPVSTIMS